MANIVANNRLAPAQFGVRKILKTPLGAVLFGIILPCLSLGLDLFVVQTVGLLDSPLLLITAPLRLFMPLQPEFAYIVIGLAVVALAYWLRVGQRRGPVAGFVAGILLCSGLIALGTGLIVTIAVAILLLSELYGAVRSAAVGEFFLPLTLFLVLSFVLVLPLGLTAFVYLRNGMVALTHARTQVKGKWCYILVLLGLLFTLILPLGEHRVLRRLPACLPDCQGAQLNNAQLRYVYLTANVVLAAATLDDALLSHATLVGTDLRGAKLRRADLRHATLQGVALTGADLVGADLTGVSLGEVDLRQATLRGARLDGVQTGRVLLTGANLSGSQAVGAHFGGVYDLQGANLSDADLREATLPLDLDGVLLRGVDLRATQIDWQQVSLVRTDLSRANLSNIDLRGVDLSQAILRATILVGAYYDQTTQWPTGFDPTLQGATRRD